MTLQQFVKDYANIYNELLKVVRINNQVPENQPTDVNVQLTLLHVAATMQQTLMLESDLNYIANIINTKCE